MAEERLILTEDQISQIIKRIAFEIYENNYQEGEVLLIGVKGQGQILAAQLHKQLQKIAPHLNTELVSLEIDKEKPDGDIRLSCSSDRLENAAVVLIDDVLNSGRTLAHSLSALLKVPLKKVQTAVLVNRSHKKFPLLANFSGYELSTTITEHVDVRLEGKIGVYLY